MLISLTTDGGDNYYYKNYDGDGDGDCDGNDNDGDDVGDDGDDDGGGGGGDGDGVDEKPREIWWLCPHATSGRPFTNNSSPLACHDRRSSNMMINDDVMMMSI